MNDEITLILDPGIRFAGLCVFSNDDSILETKTIKFDTKLSQEKRLYQLYTYLTEISSRYKITTVITEYQFVNIMSNIVGVVMAFAGSINDVKFEKVTPSSWKKTAFGKGNINEAEMRDKILERYPLANNESEHVIDCIGMYMAYKEKSKEVKDDISTSIKRSPKKKKSSKN